MNSDPGHSTDGLFNSISREQRRRKSTKRSGTKRRKPVCRSCVVDIPRSSATTCTTLRSCPFRRTLPTNNTAAGSAAYSGNTKTLPDTTLIGRTRGCRHERRLLLLPISSPHDTPNDNTIHSLRPTQLHNGHAQGASIAVLQQLQMEQQVLSLQTRIRI